jgi:hypothetical protein
MEHAHDLGELPAAHPRHVEVGHDQIQPTLTLADQLEGCLAVAGLQYLPPVASSTRRAIQRTFSSSSTSSTTPRLRPLGGQGGLV